MEKAIISVSTEIDNNNEYVSVSDAFITYPEIAQSLLIGASNTLSKIEKMMYSAPSIINAIKASIPAETIQLVLTNEQKSKIASGALKLMTKKDGTLMANLINPKTKKIVETINLEKITVSPELSQAMTSYATQMQMAQIAEQIQLVQIAVEDVRQGQEFDRLSTAYSCQQKLLQAINIKNPELKAMALMRIALDAEDSRNLLMQSQNANVSFIKNQPESFWGKLISGAAPNKIDSRMNELRENLCAVNIVSFVEAMAYQQMGEPEVAQQSLAYYAEYLHKTYLDTPKFLERLDMIDPSPENYWSKSLPNINEKIQKLPCNINKDLLRSGSDE